MSCEVLWSLCVRRHRLWTFHISIFSETTVQLEPNLVKKNVHWVVLSNFYTFSDQKSTTETRDPKVRINSFSIFMKHSHIFDMALTVTDIIGPTSFFLLLIFHLEILWNFLFVFIKHIWPSSSGFPDKKVSKRAKRDPPKMITFFYFKNLSRICIQFSSIECIWNFLSGVLQQTCCNSYGFNDIRGQKWPTPKILIFILSLSFFFSVDSLWNVLLSFSKIVT